MTDYTTPGPESPAFDVKKWFPLSGIDEIKVDAIPTELKALNQWVAWKAVDAGAGKKPRKVLVDPSSGYNAKSNDPTTWGTFEQAVKRAAEGCLPGIGLAFAGDDLIGIDLDDVMAEGRFVNPLAEAFVRSMDSYCEVSPSGKGVKMWVRSSVHPTRCTGTITVSGETVDYETYHKGRWFAVTGHALPQYGKGKVQERSDRYARMLEKGAKRPRQTPTSALSLPVVPATGSVADNEAMLRAALKHIDASAEGTWFRMACCLKAWGAVDGVGDARARALWDEWSKSSPKFNLTTQADRWDRIKPDGGLTIGTIFAEAAEEGYCHGDAIGEDGVEFHIERKEPYEAALDAWIAGEYGPDYAPKPREEEQFYYDSNRKEYLLKNERGVWLRLTEAQFRKELAFRGMRTKARDGENVSETDAFIIGVRNKSDVAYSGILAGHNEGYYDMGAYRMLVTTSPKLIEPKKGDFSTLDKFLGGMLDEPGFRQRDFLYGWLKVAYESLRNRMPRPGQALAIAGPGDCGKSLFQSLVTEMLGGRYAKPGQFMMGLTPFNSDMFEGEHLMMDDESSSTDIRARRSFGSQIKQVTVVEAQRYHAKNCPALSLKPFWRLTITLNDEAENLMVLPPLDDSLEDKLIILRAHTSPMPMPTIEPEERKAFWEKLVSELPAFLHWLMEWQVPEELRGRRFGVTHFHHPSILAEVDALSPEARLLSLINTAVFSDRTSIWEGTAESLEKTLTDDANGVAYEARRLFTFNTACGVYLGRLAKKHPARFQYGRGRDIRRWTIHPPVRSDAPRPSMGVWEEDRDASEGGSFSSTGAPDAGLTVQWCEKPLGCVRVSGFREVIEVNEEVNTVLGGDMPVLNGRELSPTWQNPDTPS